MAQTKQTAKNSVGGKAPRKQLQSKSSRKTSNPPSAPPIKINLKRKNTSIPKKRKNKPGTVALREIRKYQRTTELLIPKSPFTRLLNDVIADVVDRDDYRTSNEAKEALQILAEDFLIRLFEDSNICAIHSKRVTIMKKDILLAKKLVKYPFI